MLSTANKVIIKKKNCGLCEMAQTRVLYFSTFYIQEVGDTYI